MFSSLPFNYIFFVVVIFGTLFSISSSHWLGIWAGLEINLIGFLPLLVYQKSISERESAVKYFVIQALGSRLLLFGSLGTYSLSFSWESLNSLEDFSYLSLLIISAGLILKMGIFPFHFWFPGVIAGLPWLSCLFLSTWQKVGPLFLIISLLEVNLITWLLLTFCVVASGSRLLGGLGGINQTQVRALLAYSSIGHLGWIIFAGIHRTWAMGLYFGIYVLISFCIFVSLWFIDLKFTKNLVGVLSLSYSALIVIIILLSLGGLPPMLGFISKWAVIIVRVSQTLRIFIILLIVGSLIRLFYYLSLFFSLFLGALKEKRRKNLVLGNVAWMHRLGLLVNFLGGFLLLVRGVLWRV